MGRPAKMGVVSSKSSLRGTFGTILIWYSIVAVHGIAADPKRTWTKNGVDWLMDDQMLPSAVPNARIFRFGYESDWLGSKAVQVKVSSIANQLLQALKASRPVSSEYGPTKRRTTYLDFSTGKIFCTNPFHWTLLWWTRHRKGVRYHSRVEEACFNMTDSRHYSLRI